MAIQPAGKAVLFVLAACVLVGVMFLVKSTGALDKYIAPKGHQAGSGEIPKGAFKGAGAHSDVVKIGTVTWPGYAGGELYNGGFVPSTTSRYWTEQGIKVEFVNEDDVKASREAWRTDNVQIMWGTADALPTEMNGLGQFKPRVILQADWSQGGDGIVAVEKIKSANDMIGKKIAFAEATPSHTFLLYALDAAGLNYSDIEPVIVNSAIEAAQTFRDGKCDLAVVWSPDDEDCVAKVKGAHILMSSKDAQIIIADCFFAKDAWVQANKETVNKIVKGWMIGAAEINSQDASKHQAAGILSAKLGGGDEAVWYGMLGKVRVCTWGDNMRFFGLDPSYAGMTGEKLYTKMSKIFLHGSRQPTRTLSRTSRASLEAMQDRLPRVPRFIRHRQHSLPQKQLYLQNQSASRSPPAAPYSMTMPNRSLSSSSPIS